VGWAMTGGEHRAAALRRAVLALICRVPGFSALVLDNTSPRLPPGLLIRPRPAAERARRPGRELAGALCPQPWVTLDGIRYRLDDILGPEFTLLTAGPARTSTVIMQTSAFPMIGQTRPAPAIRPTSARSRCVSVPDHGDQGERGGETAAATGVIRFESPELRQWLARARMGSVLLRPDHIVLGSAAPGRPIW
jgi:3-(3-hydroxy-phenyl)propionate hydroxylase